MFERALIKYNAAHPSLPTPLMIIDDIQSTAMSGNVLDPSIKAFLGMRTVYVVVTTRWACFTIQQRAVERSISRIRIQCHRSTKESYVMFYYQ